MELYQHTLVTAVGLNTAVGREEQCTIYVANNVSVCNAPGALTNAQAHNATMPRLVMHLKLVPRPMPRLVISRLQIQITMKCYKIDTCSTSQLSQIPHPPTSLTLVFAFLCWRCSCCVITSWTFGTPGSEIVCKYVCIHWKRIAHVCGRVFM